MGKACPSRVLKANELHSFSAIPGYPLLEALCMMAGPGHGLGHCHGQLQAQLQRSRAPAPRRRKVKVQELPCHATFSLLAGRWLAIAHARPGGLALQLVPSRLSGKIDPFLEGVLSRSANNERNKPSGINRESCAATRGAWQNNFPTLIVGMYRRVPVSSGPELCGTSRQSMLETRLLRLWPGAQQSLSSSLPLRNFEPLGHSWCKRANETRGVCSPAQQGSQLLPSCRRPSPGADYELWYEEERCWLHRFQFAPGTCSTVAADFPSASFVLCGMQQLAGISSQAYHGPGSWKGSHMH